MQDPTFDPMVTTKSYGGGQNYILIRYAEILLNFAEAAYKIGLTEDARIYVNKVRKRPSVNMPDILPGEITLEKSCMSVTLNWHLRGPAYGTFVAGKWNAIPGNAY